MHGEMSVGGFIGLEYFDEYGIQITFMLWKSHTHWKRFLMNLIH